MQNKTEMAEFFENMVLQLQSLDGKIVGEEINSSELRLSKDDKGAWIKYLADQYLKKEPMGLPPKELEIVMQDIIDELANREIEKVLKEY